jgi:hypothetical protein
MTIEDIIGINIQDFLEYAKQYKIKYSNVIDDTKGRINYKYHYIDINPIYNDVCDTLIHELLHHHYDKEMCVGISESEIEKQTQLICKNKYDVRVVKQYLKENTDLYR